MSNSIAELGAADFLSGIQGLLPYGDAVNVDPDSMLTALLEGLSGRTVAVHEQAALLSEIESDPRQTTLLLPDWERCFGLPDPCLGPAPTYAERRAQLVARIASGGGASEAYLISFAAALGYPITITTFQPFNFGQSFGLPIYGLAWGFAWRVNAPTINYQYFYFGANNFGDPLAEYSNTVLQCELKRIAPAHTFLFFEYGTESGSIDLDFSVPANSQYLMAL